MKKVFLNFCVLLLCALSLAGQTSNWKEYNNRDASFTVLFPGEPQDSVNGGDASVKSHTLMAREGKVIFTVVYTIPAGPQKVDDATYQVFKNAVFKELPKCAVETEQEPAPALNGYVGHWYRLTCDISNTKVFIEGNLYWGKNYAYAVMMMWPDGVERSQMETKFLQSFAVQAAN